VRGGSRVRGRLSRGCLPSLERMMLSSVTTGWSRDCETVSRDRGPNRTGTGRRNAAVTKSLTDRG